MSKGSRNRTRNTKSYGENYDAVFGNKSKEPLETPSTFKIPLEWSEYEQRWIVPRTVNIPANYLNPNTGLMIDVSELPPPKK
jgi:hypothetical protein